MGREKKHLKCGCCGDVEFSWQLNDKPTTPISWDKHIWGTVADTDSQRRGREVNVYRAAAGRAQVYRDMPQFIGSLPVPSITVQISLGSNPWPSQTQAKLSWCTGPLCLHPQAQRSSLLSCSFTGCVYFPASPYRCLKTRQAGSTIHDTRAPLRDDTVALKTLCRWRGRGGVKSNNKQIINPVDPCLDGDGVKPSHRSWHALVSSPYGTTITSVSSATETTLFSLSTLPTLYYLSYSLEMHFFIYIHYKYITIFIKQFFTIINI